MFTGSAAMCWWQLVLFSNIIYGVVSNWIILQQSTDFYDDDWNDMDRRWYKIKHIHTNNGNNIKRKCTIYSDGNQLCLCQFVNLYLNQNIQHLCFNQHTIHLINNQQSLPLYFEELALSPNIFIIDSFPNDMDNYNNYGDNIIASAIRNGLNYYIESFKEHKKLPIDSIFLLTLIAKNDMEYRNIANLYYKKLKSGKDRDYNNPFCRIFSKSSKITQRFNDLKFIRYDQGKKEKVHKIHNLYALNKKYSEFYVDPSDDVVLKALFCDIKGYDDIDFEILMKMANYRGEYEDTHTIISLNILSVNQCYQKKKIHFAMSKVGRAILNKLNKDFKNNENFGDIFFEKVVSLYWAGFGDQIKKQWIVKIAKYQSKIDYGYYHDYQQNGYRIVPIQDVSGPHPTGLAILAMIYYEIGESKQSFYPIHSL